MNEGTAKAPRVRVRVRIAGTQDSETYQMSEPEAARFLADWKAYLEGGGGKKGGQYTCQIGENPVLIGMNFDQFAYIEPGKSY